MRFKRFGVSLLVAGLALLGTASPALAHAELKSSDPARGASLATPPTQVKLTFSGPVTLADQNPIEITGPENASWTVGRAEVAGSVVTAPVQAVGPAGEYTLRYKVTFEDTHAASGSVKFTLSAPVANQSAPAQASSSSQAPAQGSSSAAPAPQAGETTPEDLVPAWVWIVLAVAVVVAGIVVALRFVRRKG
ncbi:copper resistance protein CopC [Amycolatopsis sp. QT-25]|uniref:copper resistance CopC family protein n=1 Tax=Amycolatopsis sp. QT-25 TaxID=3034022 RepID=UPI0023EE28FB|nr:copper resistance CopC family protein [Amycolatopsis sp. QT-25]WET79869.1 copper resistance protein CopC [Amycolatopsis sp. QT-25]